MENSMKPNQRPFRAVRVTVATLALAAAFSSIGAAAVYANDDHRGGDRRDHGDNRHWHHGRPDGYVYETPGAYYGPPPVTYYQPPPPSPGIDFVFPLHIR